MKIPLKKRYYNRLQIMTALQDICTQEQLTGIEARLMETQCDDVEEVTRCNDCEHYVYSWLRKQKLCVVFSHMPKPTDYCYFGERKERKGNDND